MEPTQREVLQREMVALHRGDRSAFEAVYGLVWPVVRRFSIRFLGAEADGEDAAQQALLKVFERIMEYDPKREALPWILGIAYHECRSVRKSRWRQQARESGEDADSRVSSEPDPEEALMSEELRQSLLEVMGTLRPQDVETLWASAGQRPRPDLPGATFRKRVQRAMGRLRQAWSKRHEG